MTATAFEPAPAELDKRIENILHDKLSHFLDDISFRIGQAYEVAERAGGGGKGTVYAEDLNIKDRVFLTGYTVSNNMPSAGSIAWADLHVVYNGVDHVITNGNTALKYIYFTASATPTTLKSSATKPALADGDVLLFVNEGGVARNMLSDTNASMPRVIAPNGVDTDAIADNAVTSDQIKAQAVVAGKIGNGAINNTLLFNGKVINSTVIADQGIESGAIKDNAITTLKVADGAISKSTQLANKVVTATQIGDKAVGTGQLGDLAVDTTKIKDGAISKSSQIVNKVVDSNNLVNGAVTSLALGAGAVDAAKLNIMRHIMY